MLMFLFFFFTQKTAYEMRISDWSSDVCSSDLGLRCGHFSPPPAPGRARSRRAATPMAAPARFHQSPSPETGHVENPPVLLRGAARRPRLLPVRRGRAGGSCRRRPRRRPLAAAVPPRSEEHTSELQSLMRISYAVFCLKKKKTK